MSDLEAIADRFEIEALRGEFTDAAMMRDYDRFASLFTQDGAWRIPYVSVEFVSRGEIRAGIERLQGHWDYFVQTTHPARSRLRATPRSAVPTSQSSGASVTAGRSCTTPCTTTVTSAPRTAGSSPSASTRSDTSTPLRWRARRPTQRPGLWGIVIGSELKDQLPLSPPGATKHDSHNQAQ